MRRFTIPRFAALVLFAALAHGQEGGDPKGPPPLPELGPSSPQEELLNLFRRVRTNLRKVDRLLAEAAAGESPLEELRESGLDDILPPPRDEGSGGVGDLLAGTKTGGERVVRDIDRILEVVQQSGAGT